MRTTENHIRTERTIAWCAPSVKVPENDETLAVYDPSNLNNETTFVSNVKNLDGKIVAGIDPKELDKTELTASGSVEKTDRIFKKCFVKCGAPFRALARFLGWITHPVRHPQVDFRSLKDRVSLLKREVSRHFTLNKAAKLVDEVVRTRMDWEKTPENLDKISDAKTAYGNFAKFIENHDNLHDTASAKKITDRVKNAVSDNAKNSDIDISKDTVTDSRGCDLMTTGDGITAPLQRNMTRADILNAEIVRAKDYMPKWIDGVFGPAIKAANEKKAEALTKAEEKKKAELFNAEVNKLAAKFNAEKVDVIGEKDFTGDDITKAIDALKCDAPTFLQALKAKINNEKKINAKLTFLEGLNEEVQGDLYISYNKDLQAKYEAINLEKMGSELDSLYVEYQEARDNASEITKQIESKLNSQKDTYGMVEGVQLDPSVQIVNKVSAQIGTKSAALEEAQKLHDTLQAQFTDGRKAFDKKIRAQTIALRALVEGTVSYDDGEQNERIELCE